MDDADSILTLDDLNDVLDELFQRMIIYCYDEDESLNELGKKAQAVYDSILYMD